jgi:DNA-binding phage protein
VHFIKEFMEDIEKDYQRLRKIVARRKGIATLLKIAAVSRNSRKTEYILAKSATTSRNL